MRNDLIIKSIPTRVLYFNVTTPGDKLVVVVRTVVSPQVVFPCDGSPSGSRPHTSSSSARWEEERLAQQSGLQGQQPGGDGGGGGGEAQRQSWHGEWSHVTDFSTLPSARAKLPVRPPSAKLLLMGSMRGAGAAWQESRREQRRTAETCTDQDSSGCLHVILNFLPWLSWLKTGALTGADGTKVVTFFPLLAYISSLSPATTGRGGGEVSSLSVLELSYQL